MAVSGRTPSQRTRSPRLIFEPVDNCDYGTIQAFRPVRTDDLTGFRVEVQRTFMAEGGVITASDQPGTADLPKSGAFPAYPGYSNTEQYPVGDFSLAYANDPTP